MNTGTAEVLRVNILACNGFYHLRTCKEHITCAFGHQNEVGKSRGVNGTAGARTKDHGDLRNDPRSKDVTLKDLTISGERGDTLLNTSAATVVHANDRSTVLHSHIHNLTDLLCHCLGERTTVDREVLGIDINKTTVDSSGTGYDTITEELLLLHAEVVTTVKLEHVVFLERILVYKHFDALTGCVLAAGMLLVDSLLSTTKTGLLTLGYKLLDFLSLNAHNFPYL